MPFLGCALSLSLFSLPVPTVGGCAPPPSPAHLPLPVRSSLPLSAALLSPSSSFSHRDPFISQSLTPLFLLTGESHASGLRPAGRPSYDGTGCGRLLQRHRWRAGRAVTAPSESSGNGVDSGQPKLSWRRAGGLSCDGAATARSSGNDANRRAPILVA